MENWMNVWKDAVTIVSGVALWQWILVGFILLYLFKNPAKRFVKRQVRKVKKLIVRLVRLYFIGM